MRLSKVTAKTLSIELMDKIKELSEKYLNIKLKNNIPDISIYTLTRL